MTGVQMMCPCAPRQASRRPPLASHGLTALLPQLALPSAGSFTYPSLHLVQVRPSAEHRAQLASPVVVAQPMHVPLTSTSRRLVQRVHCIALAHWAQPAEQASQWPVALTKKPCS